MARRIRPLVVSAALSLILLALLLPLTSRSQTASPSAARAAAARDGLIVTTGGSWWWGNDDRPFFTALQPYLDRLDVVSRLPLEGVSQEYADMQMPGGEIRWFEIPASTPLPETLIVDLEGSTPGFGGLNVYLTVWDSQTAIRDPQAYVSAQSLHVDQPISQTYRVRLWAFGASTCTLKIGSGQSPFLSTPLDSYAFLLFPGSGPLSARETARIHQYVQDGGKLVVLASYLVGHHYYVGSSFEAMNELLNGCGMEFTGQLLTTTLTTEINGQTINILTDIRPHSLTQGVDQVVSTGSTLQLSGAAQGLVFDDQGDPVIAVSQVGSGQCLAIGTGIGFMVPFHQPANDPLAANLIEWASVRGNYVVFLPVVLRGSQG